jgi:hypothetical protein
MQALLFGTNDLYIFRDAASRRAMVDYLAKIVRVAERSARRRSCSARPRIA